jgi:hypothetical protein
MNTAITLHIETSNRHFVGYIEHANGSTPLTEDQFQSLVETLAGTDMTADAILRDFVAHHDAAKKGWIKWDGGDHPDISPSTEVLVEYRGEQEHDGIRMPLGLAYRFEWRHHGGGDDVVAYKLWEDEPWVTPTSPRRH